MKLNNLNNLIMLRDSCLVISDSDLIHGYYTSISDINLHSIKRYNLDCHMASMVLYDGLLGQKVLKLRMAKVSRNGTDGYRPYHR